MPTGKLREKQDRLESLLQTLSEIELNISIEQAIEELKDIYSNKFRHFYSSLCNTFKKLYNSDKLRSLGERINQIIAIVKSKKDYDKNFVSNLHKLFDHMNLELIRFDSQESFERQLSETKARQEKMEAQTKEKLEQAEGKLQEAKDELDKAQKNYSKSQNQVIAVLSIFSAIVIAFTGGMSLLSGAFTAIKETPIIKVIVLVLTCGGLLYNSIFMLLYYIAKITDKNIYSYCRKKKTRCDENCSEDCCLIVRTYRKLPMLFYVNIGILLAIVGCIVYQIGVVNNWYINLFA